MIECKNHDSCISDALVKADLICSEQKVRFTDLRRKIFKIILENHRPVKAYDVLDKLQESDSSAKPPTVYRALDFLLEHGIIHKLHSSNSYTACSHPGKHNKCYFLICDKCGELKECCDENLTKVVNKITSANNFKVRKSVIEISGLCESC
jgi:Fur family zinc uptake transcriptional regulator